jgi:nucleoside-diphosphate-sugar epimerase
MTVLVTGGAGFLGTRLITALLGGATAHPVPDRVLCVDRIASPLADARVVSCVGSVTDAAFLATLADPDLTTVWHLAAVLSGQSEAEPDLAAEVNVGGTLALLAMCRTLPRPPRFVLASTVAVFGGPLPEVVPEDLALRPATSYGVTKAIAELHVLEATRRGVVDGVAVRVPTVAVRPGAPNSAMSSFVSGIVREPLAGLPSACPVPLDTRLWVASPVTTTANLAAMGAMASEAIGEVRTLNLPGLTVTPADLLAALERAAGAEARARVALTPDAAVDRMVRSWPGAFDVTRAFGIGLVADADADAIVAQFIAERAAP